MEKKNIKHSTPYFMYLIIIQISCKGPSLLLIHMPEQISYSIASLVTPIFFKKNSAFNLEHVNLS
jgi:hypothetical protein